MFAHSKENFSIIYTFITAFNLIGGIFFKKMDDVGRSHGCQCRMGRRENLNSIFVAPTATNIAKL